MKKFKIKGVKIKHKEGTGGLITLTFNKPLYVTEPTTIEWIREPNKIIEKVIIIPRESMTIVEDIMNAYKAGMKPTAIDWDQSEPNLYRIKFNSLK